MIYSLVLFLSTIILHLNACVPTKTITTTTTTKAPCCDMLSQWTLPRRTPSSDEQEQCSVLQRVSSTCPIDGIVVCDAAQWTNPKSIQIEFFHDEAVNRVVKVTGSPATSVTVKVICIDGVWRVPKTTDSEHTWDESWPITGVSCSQWGSQGYDKGYVVGTAI